MYKLIKYSVRFYCHVSNRNGNKMKYLNVAEKNDAAKTIAGHLSKGTSRRREGISQYNKIYEFESMVRGTKAHMVMTSVSGHLLTHEFIASYRNWQGCDPISLFDARVRKCCPENYVKIKSTLEREIRSCHGLIIWTDCDREGENIGFEIIDVCRAIKPNIPVYRAKFSEITAAAANRALATLSDPDEKQSQAVDVRSELDLRIGAAFTRFQTLRFQLLFPNELQSKLVSYGSCQIPTLGFVTQRFKETEDFIPKPFWKLKLTHTIDPLTVEFNWARHRLFDKQCCEAFLMICQANSTATIHNVTQKPKSKWRPTPMDTIALEKLGSKWLKISAKQTMTIAEKLYTQGFISYPRTETNMFSHEMDFRPLIEQQSTHPDWGQFANKVLQWGPSPRNGKKSDQAHPPIHPTKFTTNLGGDEKKVYELVVRHFLACVSRDATGSETIVNARIADEEFTASGLCVHERNYLEVYIYEKWNSREIHPYQIGDTFDPTELTMNEGTTTAPSLLTEAELIALMDKHGIGTDATHAEHINTIKEREYIGVIDRGLLVPGILGMGLVEGYDAVELPLAQPKLRAALERDLKQICTGERDPKEVLDEQIRIYREAFRTMTQKARQMDESLANRLNVQPQNVPLPNEPSVPNTFKEIFKCPKCNECAMALKTVGQNNSYVISCMGYPNCRNSFWFDADIIKEASATDEICSLCRSKLITFKIKSVQMMSMLEQSKITGLHYKTCVVCDSGFRDLCNIEESRVIPSLSNTSSRSNAIIPIGRANSSAASSSSSNSRSRTENTRMPPPQSNRPNSSQPRSSTTNTNRPPNRRLSPPPSPPRGGTRSSSNINSNQSRGWGIDPPSPPPPSSRSNSFHGAASSVPRSNQSNAGAPVLCGKCGEPSRKLTVRKEGPNTGRQFYSCKPECNFFQWAETNDAGNVPGNSNHATTSRASNSTGSNAQRNGNSDTGGGSGNSGVDGRPKRRCGNCREEGHRKNKCPRQGNNQL